MAGPFAKNYEARWSELIRGGAQHPSIGPNLPPGVEKETAGEHVFKSFVEKFGITTHSKVVDYGCGSGRIGAHFVKYLNPGNYMGLEVGAGFVKFTRDFFTELQLEDKKPVVEVIDAKSVDSAAKFGADFAISNAVAFHVHPDERASYYSALIDICGKPGSKLIFDIYLSTPGVRFLETCWSIDRDELLEHCKPMALRSSVRQRTRAFESHTLSLELAEFERLAA